MEKKREPETGPSPPSRSRVDLIFRSFESVAAAGRHGIALYGITREQLIIAIMVVIIVGIPFGIILAVLPFWDRFGELSFIKQLNSYICPAIDALSFDFKPDGMPRLHLKRFLIGIETIIGFIFLTNFISLLSPAARKHSLLVWICYDRHKLLMCLAVSGLIFFGLWFFFFYDWTLLSLVSKGRKSGAGIIMYAIAALPIVALFFGHLLSIVVLGVSRAAYRRFR